MIWKVVSPCIEESRFLLWSWWGLCKKKRCPFDHLNKKAFDWSNSGIMTRRNLKKSLRPKIMHHLDETLVSSINSQHILDYKWKPMISDFQRFFSKSYSNWCITKDWKTSDNLFLNTVNWAHSKIIYDNLIIIIIIIIIITIIILIEGAQLAKAVFGGVLMSFSQDCEKVDHFRTVSWDWPLAFLSHFHQDWWNF